MARIAVCGGLMMALNASTTVGPMLLMVKPAPICSEARSRPPRDKPWYHILVDDSDRVTYVAERHLEADDSSEPVTHPAIGAFFTAFEHGSYRLRQRAN